MNTSSASHGTATSSRWVCALVHSIPQHWALLYACLTWQRVATVTVWGVAVEVFDGFVSYYGVGCGFRIIPLANEKASYIGRAGKYTVWVKKNPPYGFLIFFPKRLGIFKHFFTHLLYYHFYTRQQIFIQISPTLTKLCHNKRDHLANFSCHFQDCEALLFTSLLVIDW